MFDRITAVAAVLLMVVVIAVNTGGAAAGPVQPRRTNFTRQTSDLRGDLRPHRRDRRSIVDSSCKGQYDRTIWDELCYVCEDCDNVFREDGFQAKCRRGCFGNDLFSYCLGVLGKDEETYERLATFIRGS